MSGFVEFLLQVLHYIGIASSLILAILVLRQARGRSANRIFGGLVRPVVCACFVHGRVGFVLKSDLERAGWAHWKRVSKELSDCPSALVSLNRLNVSFHDVTQVFSFQQGDPYANKILTTCFIEHATFTVPTVHYGAGSRAEFNAAYHYFFGHEYRPEVDGPADSVRAGGMET